MFPSQPFLPRFSHIQFLATPSFRLGAVLDAFWWPGQICILKRLLWAQDGGECEEEPECILLFGPARDERRMAYIGRQLDWRWRAVSTLERYLGHRTSQSSFGGAMEVLECLSQEWHAWINDFRATLLKKLQVMTVIPSSLLSSPSRQVFGHSLYQIQLAG